MRVLRHAVTKIKTVQVQKVPFGTENAVWAKLTILWILAKMFMTFTHGMFPIWRIRSLKKALIIYLAYTDFQNQIFKIYILGEIMYMCFSSESRIKRLKCQYINEVKKTSIYKMKNSSKFYSNYFFFIENSVKVSFLL